MLAAAVFAVLPPLPDRTIDSCSRSIRIPCGYWRRDHGGRVGGPHRPAVARGRSGLSIAGLAGGFVSSTAMVAAMADRAHAVPELVAPARSAALMSNIATVVRLAVVIGALSPAMLQASPRR
ncbi:DUF4010 domain-containing protein [Lysobacter sp. Root667]|uniref:DUF4010 domain-containing protein n=1 Tax=Lysobacter sp. Root667 TaxID=1736581 RepID=UPI00210155B5|nr:DUF4010 domain-containing protein [Lysobacter sp. Root667]